MNLIAMIRGHAAPGRVQDALRQLFDVTVDVELTGHVWLKCFDETGRERLAIRYWWSETTARWWYNVLPRRQNPRRPYRVGGIKYLPDGSWAVNP